MNVPLLKSAIHKEIALAESSHPTGCLSNWSVPSCRFGNVCYTSGYWECIEDVLPRVVDFDNFFINIYDSVYLTCFFFIQICAVSLKHPRLGLGACKL